MEGSLRIIDGRVFYADDILDESFDEDSDVLYSYMLDESINRHLHTAEPE